MSKNQIIVQEVLRWHRGAPRMAAIEFNRLIGDTNRKIKEIKRRMVDDRALLRGAKARKMMFCQAKAKLEASELKLARLRGVRY